MYMRIKTYLLSSIILSFWGLSVAGTGAENASTDLPAVDLGAIELTATGQQEKSQAVTPQPEKPRGKYKPKKKSKKNRAAVAPRQEKKFLSTMGYQDLKERKDSLVADNKLSMACKYLEKMRPHCDMEQLKEVLLELADHTFSLGKFDKAAQTYIEFSDMYPGDEKVEYADYRAILSNFFLILRQDRDQSRTKKALTLADKFLDRSLYKEHRQEVEDIKEKCCSQLIDHEFGIVDFYLQRNSFKAVRSRLAYVKKEFELIVPQVSQRILLVECTLAEQQQDLVTLKQKQEELVTKYPHAILTFDAHGNKQPPKKKAIERF